MRQIRKYTSDFKQAAVALTLEEPKKSMREVAVQLEIPLATLNTWVLKAKRTPSLYNDKKWGRKYRRVKKYKPFTPLTTLTPLTPITPLPDQQNIAIEKLKSELEKAQKQRDIYKSIVKELLKEEA